jgi:hypothetical protein
MVECKGVLVFIGIVLAFTAVVSIVSIATETVNVIPGFHPTDYKKGSEVILKVNKITSKQRQMPFKYHDLPVCPPSDAQKKAHPVESENLGEILMGDRIEPSAFEVNNLFY